MDPTTLEREVRERRLWYNDIEVTGGVRTRFPEDYEANAVLCAIDRRNRAAFAWLDDRLPANLTGKSVLDVGCCDGAFSFWAARRGADRVLGIERCTPAFEQAEFLRGVIAPGQTKFLNGRIENHCPDTPYDYIICASLLYHLVDPLGTLHRLRRVCQEGLILNAAIDLPAGNGEPMSRLDRYATGAHGLWSFNASMVDQLLSTAGFEVVERELLEDGRDYQVMCVPSKAAAHHVFADRLAEHFILDKLARRVTVRRAWRKLSQDATGPVAIFGAGTHTPWLLEQVADICEVHVACVLDDRPLTKTVCMLPVRLPDALDPTEVSAIVLSSWGQEAALRKRAEEVFGAQIPIVSLY